VGLSAGQAIERFGNRRTAPRPLAKATGPRLPDSVSVSFARGEGYNDPDLTKRVAAALKRTLGEDNVLPAEQSMGGEDFGRFGLAGVPICMFRLGAVNQSRLDEFAAQNVSPPSLHSPLFYPDAKESLATGVTAMSAVVIDLLPPAENKVLR
jgi:metal-dependent amidase/aminoacylase/carboxypeptidase family protein